MATFLLPAEKLNNPKYIKDGRLPGAIIEEYLISEFGGFTHEPTNIKGYWAPDSNKIITDTHEKFEVGFSGRERFVKFVDFLAEICKLIEEESIYLTLGHRSYWISPK